MKKNEKFLKLTKVVKSRNFFIAVCVFVLTIFSIRYTYASFFTVKTNTNNQRITTGTLEVSYGNETSSIIKDVMEPMSDEAGMNQSEASVVYIQNTGTIDSTYTLNFGYDMTNFKNRSGYNETDKLTPLDYIMIAVYKYHGIGDEELVAGPIAISELPISTLDADSRYNRYALLFDSVGSTSSGDAARTYKIKTWLSDKAAPSVSFTYFYVNSQVVAEAEGAHLAYNLSGILVDAAGKPLNKAEISIQNRSVVATTDEAGAFKINGLYPGVYNVDITYKGAIISGNLTVVEGNDNELVSLGNTFNGTNIYNAAYSYGTTVAKILKVNGITDYSDAAQISSGKLMPTYKLTGGIEKNIENIYIELDNKANIYTMTIQN